MHTKDQLFKVIKLSTKKAKEVLNFTAKKTYSKNITLNDLHHPQNALDLHQWRSKIDSVLGTLTTALILYVPFSIGTLNPTAEIAAALAALISIILIFSNVHKYTQAIPKPIKIIMALFAIYFAIGAASYFVFPPAKYSLNNIGTSIHFVLFTPIIMVMLKHPPKLTLSLIHI